MITDRKCDDSSCNACGSWTNVREYRIGREDQAGQLVRFCVTCRGILKIILCAERAS